MEKERFIFRPYFESRRFCRRAGVRGKARWAYRANTFIVGVACHRADFAFKDLLHSYSWITKAMMFDPAATATYCLPSNM